MQPAGPLAGLRVLDLSHHVAGPYCTKLLAVCGADVVKVERPWGGDPLRRAAPLDGDVSLAFLDLNVNKRGVTLDLRRDRERALELAARADVVVESFRPGTLARLGLGYDELRARKPEVVLTSISNFGQTGPYRDLDATEIVLYAMGHEMYGTGQPDAEPMSMAPRLNLCFAGQTAAVGTMACVLGGTSEWIDVSIMETFLTSIDRRADSLVAYAYCGEKMTRLASLGMRDLPPQYNRARDGWFHLGASSRSWPTLAALAGEDRDPEDRQAFLERWASWCAAHGKLETVAALQAAGIPAAPVNSVADLAADPQLAARGFFRDTGGRRLVGPFARFAGTPGEVRFPAPQLGEHNDEIFTGSGVRW
jgi:crotonobetainyl-CoA:carnitine CoA-transferase CaiB-like acyl-CoA transferase